MIQLFCGADFTITINLADLSSNPIPDATLSLTIKTKEGDPLLFNDGTAVGALAPANQGGGVYTLDMTHDMAITPNQPYYGNLTTTDTAGVIVPYVLEIVGVQEVA